MKERIDDKIEKITKEKGWVRYWSTGDRTMLVFKDEYGVVRLSHELEPKKGNYDLNYDPLTRTLSYKRYNGD